ncbi:Spo0E family sporulation regulatory protein-aspartic acid phosphatase [Clostridium sp. CF012]|nr:Spo0E family sporulation regulatory protein-aspartic acid phosphatase [Clostridium sp. CF012]
MFLIEDKKGNLVDSEVVNISKILNASLNQYNKVLEEKLNR